VSLETNRGARSLQRLLSNRTDPDLDSLRARDDFEKLLRETEAKTKSR
jgi:hypothetical protein